MGQDGLDTARERGQASRRASQSCDAGQDVSLVTFPRRRTPFLGQQLSRRCHQVYASGSLRVATRLQARLALAERMTVHDVAQRGGLGAHTVRDSLNRCLWWGVAVWSLHVPRATGAADHNATPRTRRCAYSWSASLRLSRGRATRMHDRIHQRWLMARTNGVCELSKACLAVVPRRTLPCQCLVI